MNINAVLIYLEGCFVYFIITLIINRYTSKDTINYTPFDTFLLIFWMSWLGVVIDIVIFIFEISKNYFKSNTLSDFYNSFKKYYNNE